SPTPTPPAKPTPRSTRRQPSRTLSASRFSSAARKPTDPPSDSMSTGPSALERLLSLSHELGREERALATLGEGNTSARTGEDSFLVKASGSNLATLATAGVTECRLAPLVAILDDETITDERVETALLDARVDASARKPSVEAMFHAWLLTLPGVG